MRSLKARNSIKHRVNNSDAYRGKAKWKKARQYVLHRDGGVCAACGAEPYETRDLHIDHIIPSHKYDGSVYDTDNLQILCRSCHSSKTIKEVM
ncbi:MAG: HNH endonuclease [Phaeodactylibacter sp.]|nr:HNH endonuclease [Phaeodactylibacter sp.]